MAVLLSTFSVLLLLTGPVLGHPSGREGALSPLNSREKRSNLDCSKYKTVCTPVGNKKCELEKYVCRETLLNQCWWDVMEMVVHRTVENCDANGNCVDNEIQEIQERPVRRCKSKIVPASECLAEHPRFLCEECITDDTEDQCVSMDDFDPVRNFGVVSAACLCELLNENGALLTEKYLGRTLLGLAAGETGRHDLVKVLLDAGAEVDVRDSSEQTPLIYASSGFKEDFSARLLLDAGADPRATGDNGDTPLHHAALSGRLDVVRMLLRRGADVDATEDDGYTALMYATDAEVFPDVVKFLVKTGANVNLVSEHPYTALLNAAATKNPDSVRVLLKAGADVTALDRNGRTPLVLAINYGPDHAPIVKELIIPGPSLLAIDPETGNNVLNMCIDKEIPGCTKYFLKLGLENLPFTLEEVSDEGFTPLMQTIRSRQYESAMLLIDNGADVNVQLDSTPEHTALPDETTPLMLAARNSYDTPASLQLVQKLLDNGANVVVTDINGDTLFTLMAAMNPISDYSSKVLEALIAALPDNRREELMNQQNGDSKRPLRLSMGNAYPDNPDLLAHTYQFVEAGADLSVMTPTRFEWLTQHAITDEAYGAVNKIFEEDLRTHAVAEVVPSPQWTSTAEVNLARKVPNAWNLVRLSESDSKTDDERAYVDHMANLFPTSASEAFLNHWNTRRGTIEQDSSLTDEEKSAINAVLDEFSNSR